MLIDTHCHLTFDSLAPQVEAVLQRARDAGVERVINVATNLEDAKAGVALQRAYGDVELAAAIHPHEAGKCAESDLAQLAALHRGEGEGETAVRPLVAVGETGLDFHYDFAPRDRQEEVFCFHVELAVELRRPLVIHAREAEERVCDILDKYPQLEGRFVFHCYSAGIETARRILDAGGLLSFTGVATFKNAETVRQSARYAPRERIMIETDAPYLSPEPMRKVFPNEPAFITHTARFLADLRGERLATFAEATTANAMEFFKLTGERT